MIDSRFHLRALASLLDDSLPSFGKRGACAEKAPNRAPLAEMFEDDLAYQRNPDAYVWPPGINAAMAICAGCSVRLECLAWAYAVEKRESQDWWTGELVENDRRYGVLGGVPGRIREHFAEAVDPIAACDDWFQRAAQGRHLAVADIMQEREEAI